MKQGDFLQDSGSFMYNDLACFVGGVNFSSFRYKWKAIEFS